MARHGVGGAVTDLRDVVWSCIDWQNESIDVGPLREWLAARDPQPAPTDDERDVLILIARDVHLYDSGPRQAFSGESARRIADAALAAGFRRQPPTPSPAPPTREALAEALRARWSQGGVDDWGDMADAVLALLNGETR